MNNIEKKFDVMEDFNTPVLEKLISKLENKEILVLRYQRICEEIGSSKEESKDISTNLTEHFKIALEGKVDFQALLNSKNNI